MALLPCLILRSRDYELLPANWSITHFAGTALIMVGGLIMATCILRLVTEGKGTISPLDPTKNGRWNAPASYRANDKDLRPAFGSGRDGEIGRLMIEGGEVSRGRMPGGEE